MKMRDFKHLADERRCRRNVVLRETKAAILSLAAILILALLLPRIFF